MHQVVLRFGVLALPPESNSQPLRALSGTQALPHLEEIGSSAREDGSGL